MDFKKEFDIDKEFFLKEDDTPKKRKVAFFVFLAVFVLTILFFCLIAFSSGNIKFGSVINNNKNTLKEAKHYFYDGVREYEALNYDKALEYFDKQLQIVDDPDSYVYIAKIHLERGQNDLAIENFKHALEFSPDSFEANYELGKIYSAMNDNKTASKFFTKALEHNSEDTEVITLTADSYKMSGRADDAIALYSKVLEKNPDDSFANARIGEIYFQRMQYSSTIPYFKKSIENYFDDNIALYLAKSYFELDNPKTAIEILNEILSSGEENKPAESLKKACEYKLGTAKKEDNVITKEENKVEIPINKEALDKYISQIEPSIKMNWTPPQGSNLKKASIKFTIDKEGRLLQNNIYSSSGFSEFDNSALDAVKMSSPFPPLPDDLQRDTLDIIFTFDFNIQI